MSVAQALFKLEDARDIPTVQIPKFNGDALNYVDFIEKFKLNIHDKQHLRDDMRMTQLKMHLEGEVYLPHDDKLNKVKELRLCFSCLSKGHITKDCRRKRACGKNGCVRLHNTLLHTDPVTASSVLTLDKAGILPVLRAKFRSSGGRYVWGNVLIDSGAGTTIIRKSFAKELNLQGVKERIDLAVVGGKQVHQKDSGRVKFKISAMYSAEEYTIEAHELDSTVIDVPNLNRKWLKSFSHLTDIVDDFCHKGGPIDLVLKVHYSHIHAEEEIRQGLPYEQLARKTKLGWYVIGPDNSLRVAQLCSVSFVEKKEFYELETIGIQAPDCSCPVKALSLEDKLSMKVFEETCKREGERYSIGLPWKKDPSLLPNNYLFAERRLKSLERSLLKDPVKADLYNKVINDYEQNGWATEVKPEDVCHEDQSVYYLPHHGIYRPEKQSTPLRVVFDPALLVNRTSLNSFLCKGSCLIGNLLEVLIRFRENTIAFMGDISKMFLQILLEERDTQVHRFLWRNLNQNRTPTVYRLLRVAFGDKPSPAMASYVLLQIAAENKDLYPEAAKILERDRYMDDLIRSCNTTDEAMDCITQLETVLNTGSFKVKMVLLR